MILANLRGLDRQRLAYFVVVARVAVVEHVLAHQIHLQGRQSIVRSFCVLRSFFVINFLEILWEMMISSIYLVEFNMTSRIDKFSVLNRLRSSWLRIFNGIEKNSTILSILIRLSYHLYQNYWQIILLFLIFRFCFYCLWIITRIISP